MTIVKTPPVRPKIPGTIPSGYVLGRTDPGPGPAHLISVKALGNTVVSNTPIPTVLSAQGEVDISDPQSGQVLEYNGTSWINYTVPLLGDLDISDPTTGQVLIYNGTDWVNGDPSVENLSDVSITSVSNGQVLAWDSTSSMWTNQNAGGGSSGSGTVTSVAVTMPDDFTVTGSPVTTTGTIAVTYEDVDANYVLAGPSSGDATTPTFRALTSADVPAASPTFFANVGYTGAQDNGAYACKGNLFIPLVDMTVAWVGANVVSGQTAADYVWIMQIMEVETFTSSSSITFSSVVATTSSISASQATNNTEPTAIGFLLSSPVSLSAGQCYALMVIETSLAAGTDAMDLLEGGINNDDPWIGFPRQLFMVGTSWEVQYNCTCIKISIASNAALTATSYTVGAQSTGGYDLCFGGTLTWSSQSWLADA